VISAGIFARLVIIDHYTRIPNSGAWKRWKTIEVCLQSLNISISTGDKRQERFHEGCPGGLGRGRDENRKGYNPYWVLI
jgi:hypothetical protein